MRIWKRSQLGAIFIIILPTIILVPYAILLAGHYLSVLQPIQRYPPKPPAHGLSAPKGIVEMNVIFLKPDVASPEYQMSIQITFYTNEFPNSWLALCSSLCWSDGSISANFSPNETMEEHESNYTVQYPAWRSNDTALGVLPHFDPYSFPTDYYSSDRVYISLDPAFRVDSVKLQSHVPPEFIAFFEDIGPVNFTDLPDLLQQKGFATGLVLGFSVGMARSAPSLLISSVYTVSPILSIYEVAVLSLLSVWDRKDRLAIYVGALFAIFAYFFTLRQLVPPFLTTIEAVLAMGMVLWIFVEAFLLLTGRH
jgi:hypothetical protein